MKQLKQWKQNIRHRHTNYKLSIAGLEVFASIHNQYNQQVTYKGTNTSYDVCRKWDGKKSFIIKIATSVSVRHVAQCGVILHFLVSVLLNLRGET